MPKLLHLIAACAENRVIGRGGKLPWRIPEDFKFFQDETAGKICILGRVCFETWPRAALDGRRPVVITQNQSLAKAGVRVARSLTEALVVAEELPGEIQICGGQRIYEETLALTRPMRLHLTLVHADVPGDTYFPEWRHLPWRKISRRESADENYRYTFLALDRELPPTYPGWDFGFQPGPRTTRPGFAPLCAPSCSTWTPFTNTCTMPVANWWGRSNVALSLIWPRRKPRHPRTSPAGAHRAL